jgi:hypothetical protein
MKATNKPSRYTNCSSEASSGNEARNVGMYIIPDTAPVSYPQTNYRRG